MAIGFKIGLINVFSPKMFFFPLLLCSFCRCLSLGFSLIVDRIFYGEVGIFHAFEKNRFVLEFEVFLSS